MNTTIEEGLNDKALTSLKENKLDEARRLFERYMERKPGIKSYNNLAWFYFYKDGDKVDALDLIENIDFNLLDSYYPLAIYGDLLIEEGDYVSATQVYKNALYMGGDSIVMFNLGLSYFLIEDYNKSAEWFLKSYENGLEKSLYYYFIAIRYEDLEILKEGLDDRGSKLEDKLLLGELYYEIDEFEKANEYFIEVYNENKNDIIFITKYIDTLIRLNKKDRLDQVIEDNLKIHRELEIFKKRIERNLDPVKIDFYKTLETKDRLDGNYLFEN